MAPGRQTGGHEKDECPPVKRSRRESEGRGGAPEGHAQAWPAGGLPEQAVKASTARSPQGDPVRAVHRLRAEGDAVDVARARLGGRWKTPATGWSL